MKGLGGRAEAAPIMVAVASCMASRNRSLSFVRGGFDSKFTSIMDAKSFIAAARGYERRRARRVRTGSVCVYCFGFQAGKDEPRSASL